MTIKFYTKPQCSKCDATKLMFDRLQIPVDETLQITEELAIKFRDQGIMEAPIIQITDDQDIVLDQWSGFRLDKIRDLGTIVQELRDESVSLSNPATTPTTSGPALVETVEISQPVLERVG